MGEQVKLKVWVALGRFTKVALFVYTPTLASMEVNNHLFVEENGLVSGQYPLL